LNVDHESQVHDTGGEDHMKRITVAIAGLGSRGKDNYAPVAKLLPEKMEITADRRSVV